VGRSVAKGVFVLIDHPPAVVHRPFGTTGLLPPLISDELDVIVQVLTDIEEAIDRGVPGVLSIHIKGPFLNGEGRSVHDADKLRKLARQNIASECQKRASQQSAAIQDLAQCEIFSGDPFQSDYPRTSCGR